MEGRQIVALKMRVRFSSITPASSRRSLSRVSLFAEREKPPRIQLADSQNLYKVA